LENRNNHGKDGDVWSISASFKRLLHLPGILAVLALSVHPVAASDLDDDPFSSGFLYDRFSLTLNPGERQEVLGPVYYHQRLEESETWGVPPFFSYTRDPGVELTEIDLAYPLLTLDRFGDEYRVQLLQIFSFAGGKTQDDEGKRRFTLFPFYFQQRSIRPELNYTAVMPFYGTLQNRLFRDEIFFVLFPGYARTRKKDVVTDNFLFPVFHLRKGNELKGWQVWPVVGFERKGVTWRTNSVDEPEMVGGHRKFFALWPFFLDSKTGLGTTNEVWQQSFIPFYSITRSPERDSSTYFWPFGLTLTDDRVKKFKEVGLPWPLVVFARGEGKTVNRVWPLYSRAHNATLQSDFYLWPIYKYNRFNSPPLVRERTRILFFLYSDISEKNTETGKALRRIDFWPLFTARREHDGRERLQILAPLEPLLPNNKSIERNFSPIWSVWRSEKNPKTGESSQSFLWNFYRKETGPESRQVSLLFGLIQFREDSSRKKWRIFYIPVGENKPISKGPP